MKRVFATAALFATLGTTSFACSSEEYITMSASISEMTRELVAQDPANLGEVQKIMQAAAISEYHEVTPESACSRQRTVLDALTNFSSTQDAEESAMLKEDLL